MKLEAGDCGLGVLDVLLAPFLVTLVVQLAAFGQTDCQLDPGALEVQVQGDQGEAFLISGNPHFVNFAAVGQQFAHPQRLVVEKGAGMAVGRNVHVVQLQFSLANQAEAIAQI